MRHPLVNAMRKIDQWLHMNLPPAAENFTTGGRCIEPECMDPAHTGEPDNG